MRLVLPMMYYIIPTMLAELHCIVSTPGWLYSITPCYNTCTTCVEHLLSTPGIDVNIKEKVSWYSRLMYRAMLIV